MATKATSFDKYVVKRWKELVGLKVDPETAYTQAASEFLSKLQSQYQQQPPIEPGGKES